MYDSITDRFKKYVKNYNVNLVELSKQIGVSHGVLTSITGKSSKRNLSANVREALRLHRKDIYDLITAGTEISMVAEASYEYNRTARISHIPRQAAAGDILASMDPVKDDDLELFHMPDLRPGVYFSIYARGDSMENTIYDGELLICSRLERIEDARGLFLRGKASAMQGHNHQTSEHTEPNMDGKIMTTWSIGCLCELHPQYMPINRWNHGCAFIEVADDGDFQVQNKRIMGGDIF